MGGIIHLYSLMLVDLLAPEAILLHLKKTCVLKLKLFPPVGGIIIKTMALHASALDFLK